jgi:hypothetical protein
MVMMFRIFSAQWHSQCGQWPSLTPFQHQLCRCPCPRHFNRCDKRSPATKRHRAWWQQAVAFTAHRYLSDSIAASQSTTSSAVMRRRCERLECKTRDGQRNCFFCMFTALAGSSHCWSDGAHVLSSARKCFHRMADFRCCRQAVRLRLGPASAVTQKKGEEMSV